MAKVMIGVDYGSYSFNAASSQVTLNLNGVPPKLEGILLITNVTDNIIIYNFANPALGGTLSGNVLTLDYSTVAMSNTDNLQIWYYNEQSQSVTMQDMGLILKRFTQLTERPPHLTNAGNLRVDLMGNSSVYTSNGGVLNVTITTMQSNIPGVTGLGAANIDASFIYPTMSRQVSIMNNQKIIS
jgi:hypothetical protein